MKDDGANEEFDNLTETGAEQGFDDTDEVLDDELYTVLDDSAREELEELVGLKVVGLDVWEESLSDSEDETPVTPEERIFFDCDLLFEDGIALELYAAAAYPDPDGDPVKSMDKITSAVEVLADQNLQLMDFDQADEEGGLALAFGDEAHTSLVLSASAWLVSEWEEETEDEEEEEE